MFQLQVASTDITNGNIAVSWCVEPADLKMLSDQNVVDPQVVIVVAPEERYDRYREYRKVVPLKDLMTYLEFRSSGKNTIWAFISFKSKKDAHNYYLSKGGGQYSTDILSFLGDGWSHLFEQQSDGVNKPELASAPISVEVPALAFAKEPAKWEKTWVNHWFRGKPQDQCDFRRRRLLAYTVQPIVMLLDIVVCRTLFLLISSLWLSRGMSLKPFLHPLRYGMEDVLDFFKGGSWVIPQLPEDNASHPDFTPSYLVRKLWKLPLLPAIFLPLWFFYHVHILGYIVIALAMVSLLVGISFIIATGGALWAWEALLSLLSGKEDEEPWYLDQEEVEAITCTPGMKARTSIGALPAKHRTIRLRFQDLKSKVCRPFSA